MARLKARPFGIPDAKVFEKENMLFAKIAVLKVTNHCAAPLDREAAELVSEVVLAVLDPVQNLTFGILSFGENRFSIDAERCFQPASAAVRTGDWPEFHCEDNF